MYISMDFNEWWIFALDILTIVLIVFTYFKRRKMSTVLLKLKTKKTFFYIALGIGLFVSSGDVVYYLFMQNKDLSTIINKSQGVFFCILMLYCLSNTNRITEKGIVLSDTLFEWKNIKSWFWADNSLQILIIDVLEEGKCKKNKKNSNVERKVHPDQKESVDRILNQYLPEKNTNR